MIHRWMAYFGFVMLISFTSWLNYAGDPKKSESGNFSWEATVAIAKNTRLFEEHLQSPEISIPVDEWGLPKKTDLVGKYVVGCESAKAQESAENAAEDSTGSPVVTEQKPCIPKKGNVSLDMLSPFPDLPEKQGQSLLLYKTDDLKSVGFLLNANALVFVCEKNKCEGGPYRVEAVLGKTQPELVVIRVKMAEGETLSNLENPHLRLAALPNQVGKK